MKYNFYEFSTPHLYLFRSYIHEFHINVRGEFQTSRGAIFFFFLILRPVLEFRIYMDFNSNHSQFGRFQSDNNNCF